MTARVISELYYNREIIEGLTKIQNKINLERLFFLFGTRYLNIKCKKRSIVCTSAFNNDCLNHIYAV